MARKPNVPCRQPGCAALIPSGEHYCEKHKPLHMDEVKAKPSYGWYGKRWQKARKRFLDAHPLCEECKKKGRYVKATDVDHIIPHRGDSKLFWDEGNYQALCHSCHSKKTGNEDMHPEYRF